MATHFQHREAGYGAGGQGHAGFARYWTSEMLKLLSQFGASVRRYPFKVNGWFGRPATAPAVNVEITVPGVTDPAQVVVIGCHYDGEASSTQSAYDDASGCAVELGVARAMAEFWRSHGLYPARTLRFVLFDGEEQGLLGSINYLNDSANGSVPDIVAMFNEEQNGIGYPLRFLGKLGNPLMRTYVFFSPSARNSIYPTLVLSPAQAARNLAFGQATRNAVASAFGTFRRLGYQELTYHGPRGPVWRPIFTPGQLTSVTVASDVLGSSDQVPFTLAGIPDATIAGNFTYYEASAPAGSYPYDQPQDGIALMNTFADGGAGQSEALTMALGLPGMLTTQMLAGGSGGSSPRTSRSEAGVLGQARPDGRPIAAIGSIGQVVPGRPVTLRATAFAPGVPAAKLRYSWKFGDGAAATGQSVRHAYAAGSHTLTLNVSAPGLAPRTVSEVIAAGRPVSYGNPNAFLNGAPKPVIEGRPPANPSVQLPVAVPGLTDSVGRATRPQPPSGSSHWAWIWIGVAVALIAAIGIVFRAIRRPKRINC